MQLTRSQTSAVEKIVKAFANRYENKVASFKAPTGSGKTFMASEFISRAFAIEYGKSHKMVFVVATVSNANLPKQFAKKLDQYQKFHNFKNYKIEHIESPSNAKNNRIEDIPEFILEDRKVFVFGTSSFGKKTLFHQNKTLETFLEQASNQNYEIIFIRDEAHIGQRENISQLELKNFDSKMKRNATFILEMTATPKSKINLIEMKIKDMNDDGRYLLKGKMKKTKLTDEVTNEEIIDDAIKTFKNSKKQYQKLANVIINPAMLIQVMNEAKYETDKVKNKEFHDALAILEKKLKNASLKYLKYLNNLPQVVGTNVPNTLAYAAQNDSEIDVIIFKVGPATGWDIPRANMLLQLRSVSSERLNMQTLGRIMRNPYPHLEWNQVTNKYYVWSNYQKPTRSEVFYKLEKRFLNEKFISGVINRNNQHIQNDENLYQRKVLDLLDSSNFQNHIKNLNPNSDIYYEITSYGLANVKNKILNHIYLKIENYKNEVLYEEALKLSYFKKKLNEIALSLNKNIEIVKYVFFKWVESIKEIKNQNTHWVNKYDSYELNENARALEHYNIWRDNNNPKQIQTDKFANYGYKLISLAKEDVQFLDSQPELNFFQKFRAALSTEQLKKISFFAKMPTLGSQVFYEYYSHSKGKIAKSFMDFAVKYKNKILMVEVKSEDEDYDPNKTKELLDAYRIYMEKFHHKNISLILYKYNKKRPESPKLYGYINNEWKDNIVLPDITSNFLN